jgi:hypothetical protein
MRALLWQAIAGAVLCFSACEPAPVPLNFQLVRVNTGPCNGVCPEFSLSVDENGIVAFNGKRNVLIQGSRTGTLTPAAFQALKDALRVADIASLQTDYTTPAQCPTQSHGQAELTWHIEVSGQVKDIRQNLGCASAPDANGQTKALPAQLNALFLAMLDLSEARLWINKPN